MYVGALRFLLCKSTRLWEILRIVDLKILWFPLKLFKWWSPSKHNVKWILIIVTKNIKQTCCVAIISFLLYYLKKKKSVKNNKI